MTTDEYFDIKAKNAGMTSQEYFLESCRLEALAKPEDPTIKDFYQRMLAQKYEDLEIVTVDELLEILS